MTHYDRAEELAEGAYERLGRGDEQSAAVWAATAQVYATLAVAAAARTSAEMARRAEVRELEKIPGSYYEAVTGAPPPRPAG
jgi:hypothetical protein